MPGNKSVERAILTGWMVLGWIVLIGLAGLAALFALAKVSPLIPAGPYHDLFGTLFVMVAWPAIALALRFFVKHALWELPWF
jgi:hypothetical protein